ncbi:right-handed parallel beta-helix repeat-containing protein [Pedobacter xixiisoli]|uniref:Right handed beta helix region n=1 Tax=Pedobacter xixiisoli TaxID=1476464 RepID=A0A285ZPA2_9SPHI|nr:right-handed parallel beta-helix repeat-containing protein [Pedobacter xixiisoli]SOD11485.1 Right handed beta helix region [Pedobacter xixiisoli]
MSKKILMVAMMSLALVSCKKNSSTEKITNEKKSSQTRTASNFTVSSGMTLVQINQVLASATAGDTVWVEAGTYSITGKINIKTGVTMIKKTTANPIFDATSSTAQLLSLSYASDISNSTFSGITFWNLRFVINGSSKTTFKDCIFDYGVRKAGTDESDYSDAYIQLTDTDLPLITNCVFSRRVNHSGRGIWIKSGTSNSKIINCTFGDGAATGYFVTAINDNSQTNSLIEGNTINRNIVLNSDLLQTDHGIYAHSFNGITINKNTIIGWPPNADGGAIKARNGQNLIISNNTLNDSGILLYEYSNTPAFPYLDYVKVLNNKINVASPVNDIYHGIGYYRDNTTHTEYSIRIEGNIVPNGTISFNGTNLNINDFNAANGGVYNNDYGIINLKTGINQSGNF